MTVEQSTAQLAQDYLQQNHYNVAQAVMQLRHEIEQDQREYLNIIQQQVDQSALILDLQQQATQLVPEISGLIGELQKYSAVRDDEDMRLCEQVGFAQNNVRRTRELFDALKQVQHQVSLLTRQIAQNASLVEIQSDLLAIRKVVMQVQGSTHEYLQQGFVNKRYVDRGLSEDAEKAVQFTKPFFSRFDTFNQVLQQYIVCDAPCGLISQVQCGLEQQAANYVQILIQQENLQFNALRKILPVIAMNVVRNIGSYITLNVRRPDFKELEAQMRLNYSSVQIIKRYFDAPAPNILLQNYKQFKVAHRSPLKISHFMDLPKILTVALHYELLRLLNETITTVVREGEYFSVQFVQDLVVFHDNYNELLESLGLGYRVVKYKEITNNLQLMSQQTILGVKPHVYVQQQVENAADCAVLGQFMGRIISKVFKQQLREYWTEKATTDDRRLILQSVRLDGADPDAVDVRETFYRPICRISGRHVGTTLMDQYKAHVGRLFGGMLAVLRDGYGDRLRAAKGNHTTLSVDFFYFVDQQMQVLAGRAEGSSDIVRGVRRALLDEAYGSLLRLVSAIFGDLHGHGTQVNYQYLAGVVDGEALFKNYFSQFRGGGARPSNFDKALKLLVRPNVNYRQVFGLPAGQSVNVQGVLNRGDIHGYAKAHAVESGRPIDFASGRPDIYLVAAVDMGIMLEHFNKFTSANQDQQEDDQGIIQEVRIMINNTMTAVLAKLCYCQLCAFRDNLAALFDPEKLHTADFWTQLAQYLDSVVSSTVQRIKVNDVPNFILQQKYKEQYASMLYCVEFCAFLFKQCKADAVADYDIQLQKDSIQLEHFCTQIGLRTAFYSKKSTVLGIFAEKNIKPSNVKYLSPLLVVVYELKLDGSLERIFDENRQQGGDKFLLSQITSDGEAQDNPLFWSVIDLNVFERCVKELE